MIERKAVQLNLPTSAEVNDSENGLPVFGNKTNPDVIVICDAPKVWEFNKRTPIGKNELELFGRYVGKSGFGESEFLFISPCGPVPKEYENSEKKKAEHLALYREQFLRLLDTYSPKVIVCFGNMALRQLYGKAVMVSKARGRIDTSLPRAPVMAMNSPANVLRVPELTELFEADIRTLKRFQDTGYDANAMLPPEKDYAWGRADELRELLTSGKVTITIDSETTGLMWHRPEVYPLTVQITRREGEGRIYPVHYSYCAKHNMPYTQDEVREITRLIVQVINSPDIRMVGHNLKYDHQMFMKLEGANPKGWLHDTQLMAFMADENMRSKDLAECTRRWAPAMSGYSDIFDSTVDKSKMIDVTPDKMIDYACGDTDATMRVYKTLQGILKEDKQHANRYTRVVMPAILTFATSVERHGIPIDSSRLDELSTELSNSTHELYTKMIAAVPPAVRRKHLDKGLEFSRADFMRDILFSPEGFNLTPIVFTGTTEALPPEQRIPSTSVKDHLPYFNDNEFVQDYMTYTKLQKLRTTYVDGFLDKYATNSVIHPSYMLHRTNTGRSACVRADTLITTDKGPKRIDQIKVGDRVLTHRGRFMPVLNTFIKPIEEMYEVTFSNGEVLRCTEKHKLLTDRNGWASLRHVCIKKALGRWPTKDDSGKPLSFLIRDYVSALKKYGPDYCNSINNSSGGHTEPRIEGVESNKILSIKDGRQKPDAWKEAQELYWRQVGLQGIPYAGGRWETLLRSSDCFCGELGDSSKGLTSEFPSAPYRRESNEQLSGQSSFGDSSWSLPDTRTLREKRLPVVITGVHPCGSYPVYDIEVAVDHSYQAAGCFSHNSASPNGQNFPKRGKLAKTYRSIFKAREGFTFLECDLSQAELRLAAWESGDPVMLNTYRNGGDIHRMTAATTMKMEMEQFNALEKDVIDFKRFCAKAVNFGYVYGMGWRGFKVYAKTNYGVDYTDEEAMESRELYFQKYHYLVEWHERRRREAHRYGSVRSLHGAVRHLPSIYSNDKSIVSMAERQAINAPVQQFASDIGIMAMYRIARDCDHRIIRPIGFIHDAILLEVRSDMARELAANVKFYMQSLPLDKWFGITPPLPIVADASIGITLSSMNELKDVEAMQPEWYRPENDDKNYWEFF